MGISRSIPAWEWSMYKGDMAHDMGRLRERIAVLEAESDMLMEDFRRRMAKESLPWWRRMWRR